MKSICIYGVSNGVGITRDMGIIEKSLTGAGYNVSCVNPFKPSPTKHYDLAIWLERFNPKLFSNAKYNVMIPNQEWFEPGWLPILPHFRAIFTKTKYADEIFRNLKCNTEYISFTSEDRYLPDIKKDDYHWVHVAGKSIQKQTDIVIETWERNSGFPQLTVIQDPKFFKPRTTVRNINYMIDRAPEDVLKIIQNTSSVHVCPSITEGFGHYIMEALSCGCLPITTNAAPMNEFVSDERGFFVQAEYVKPMRLSLAHHISVEKLQDAVMKATLTNDATKRSMSIKAREFYLQNDKFFHERLLTAVGNILN